MYEKKTRRLRERVRSLQAQTLKQNPNLPDREETVPVDRKRKREDTESLAAQSGEDQDQDEEEEIEKVRCCNQVESEMNVEVQ